MAISRLEANVARIVNNAAYGPGTDGDGVISSSVVSLSSDMYYSNLTINSGCHLNTNGFRVFVKNTLTLNGTIGITSSVSVSTGTIAGRTPVSTSSAASLGGSAYGGTYTASAVPSSVLSYVETALAGSYVASGAVTKISGGAGGGNGTSGTATPATAATPGGAGSLNRNPLAPGGPGTAGTAGTDAPLAAAGTGAAGGALVLISARIITGSGQILSQGQNATAGGSSATGTPGTAGSAAPSQAVAHYTDGSAHYITGDGTHGPHATTPTPNVPHGGHVPHTSQGLHHDRYVYHYVYHNDACPSPAHGGYAHYHGYSPHNATETTSTFTAINGISHVYAHRPHTGVAYSGNTHQQHVDSSPEHTSQHTDTNLHCSNSKGSFTATRIIGYRVGYGHTNAHRNAGTVSSVGHVSKAGGTAGSAGIGAGTTAGTDGQSGGGGGIIIITEQALPSDITTSTVGGTINAKTASSGTALVIINA